MGTIPVVVVDELPQYSHEVAVVDYDQVVQALDPNRSHDSFGDRIGVRRPTWGLHAHDPHGSSPGIEVPPVDSVAVVNQMRRLVSPRRASISCRQTHAAVGLEVTLKWTSSRRRWLMKNIT
jgi:hypothetical protein